MNIGFVSTRLAGVDGVSLETAKLAKVMEETGHQCFYCAGELEASLTGKRLVPKMHFQMEELLGAMVSCITHISKKRDGLHHIPRRQVT